jgi:hypothetical protein
MGLNWRLSLPLTVLTTSENVPREEKQVYDKYEFNWASFRSFTNYLRWNTSMRACEEGCWNLAKAGNINPEEASEQAS